jgi:hypothetical protein
MNKAADIIQHIAVLGLLPKSAIRGRLIASFADEESLVSLVPVGMSLERDLDVGDVEALPPDERVAFLEGVAYILGPAFRENAYCICNMRAAVILPVAAYASLLRDDLPRARKAWSAFAKIPRLCAERLPLGGERIEGLSFEEFVLNLARQAPRPFDADFAELAVAAAEQIDRSYDLTGRRREVR